MSKEIERSRAVWVKVDLTAEEREKVLECLELLHNAQGLCYAACRSLSPVRGFQDVWNDLGRLPDAVKERWHYVEGRRQALAGNGVLSCPECGAAVRSDGSCCDECDWVER